MSSKTQFVGQSNSEAIRGRAHEVQQAKAEPWYNGFLVLLVGPGNERQLPEGKNPEDVLRDFQPDVAEWSILHKLGSSSKLPTGVATASEWQEFPQGQRDLDKWKEVIGTDWKPTQENGVDVRADGVIRPWKYGSASSADLYYVTQFCPNYHTFHEADQLDLVSDPRVGAVRQDNLCSPPGVLGNNGGFSRYTLEAFKTWLSDHRNKDDLNHLGIDHLKTWDAGRALRERIRLPLVERLEDPLAHEYTVFLNARNADFWRDEVHAVERAFPNVPVGGNQGQWNAKSPTVYEFVLLSDVGHYLFIENTVSAPYHIVNSTIPYRLMLAGGRHSKSLWAWCWDATWHENPQAYRIMTYEALAQGVTPYLFLLTLAWGPEKGYYALPQISDGLYNEGVHLAAFLHKHGALLRPAFRTEAQVAVIYSVPSFLPLVMGALEVDRGNEIFRARADRLIQTANFLDEAHVPYNFEIFGDEKLWEDGNLAERLSRYKMLVLPDVTAITDDQFDVLQKFAANGGAIVGVGEFGTREGDFSRRLTPLLSPDNTGMDSKREKLDESLSSLIKPYAVTTSAPSSVWINILKKGDSYQVHFFNRDHSPSGEIINPARSFTAEWTIPASKTSNWKAVWVTPDSESKSELEIRNGKLICTVSHLEFWGFAVIEPEDK